MTFDDLSVSSTKEKRLPSSSWAAVAFFFKLFPTNEIIQPMMGKTKREKRVNLGERINKVTNEEMIIKGELSISTKLPIIPPSTAPISLEILDIISPLRCSVKNDTGSLRNLSYMAVRKSFVIPTR